MARADIEHAPTGSRWDRLSTGLKMWIILSIGLLPLGVIAIMASADNARASRDTAQTEAQALLAQHVQRFTLALSRNAFTIRSGRDALVEFGDGQGICQRTLQRLGHRPNIPGHFAIFGRDPARPCISPGFTPPAIPEARGEIGRAIIMPGGNLIEIFLYDEQGRIEGITEYDRETLTRAVDTPRLPGDFALELVQGDRVIPLRAMSEEGARRTQISAENGFANDQYFLRVRLPEPPLGVNEIFIVLTPILMWLWASFVGWIIVQRLLLQPLKRIERVISAYKPGDPGVDLPATNSPAQEIGALGAAFGRVTQTVARHEADLEAAVVRQTRLVREVHHRVKNNLQVVASLLNLHSRGSRNEDVAAAYASIQRRVDALAVVHRNHYAELEENRGVALKPLITELTANLRATAPVSASGMQIRLDVGAFYVTQDVAVSVAFLITEITEFGMICGAGLVSVTLDRDGPGFARLSVGIDALAGAPECDPAFQERFDRIIVGLARQLRSELNREPERGLYSVRVAVVEKPAATTA
ncbi:MAG TPA: sensor histidine kinase [Allosphingosinicella sp.]|nr:sensor histidine kinase [Allosphingosinicella sp.]